MLPLKNWFKNQVIEIQGTEKAQEIAAKPCIWNNLKTSSECQLSKEKFKKK